MVDGGWWMVDGGTISLDRFEIRLDADSIFPTNHS